MAGAASLCGSLAVSCVLNSQLATGKNQSLQKFWAVCPKDKEELLFWKNCQSLISCKESLMPGCGW